MPFGQFVERFCNSEDGRDAVADHHELSQHLSAAVKHFSSIVLRDSSSLQEDLVSIREVLGVSAPVIANHSLKTSDGGHPYRRFFTAETADLVGRRYSRDDIELFGYDF